MAVYPAAEPRSFEHHVLDFLAYLEFERGLSRNTLEAYRSDLLQFGAFRARRPRRVPGRARERQPGAPARRPGHAAAQGGLPALVLPPPAPRGGVPPRPHRRPPRPAQEPEAAPGAQPRGGGDPAVGAPGDRPGRAA